MWLNFLPFLLFSFPEFLNGAIRTNQESTRLFEELMGNYNKLVRPAKVPSEAIEIQFKFKLLQILDVHEVDQVVTSSGILIHKWTDHRLSWQPNAYGNVTMLHIPGELIWLPDIILYNNAHGTPAVASVTKADVFANGNIIWEPPVIYNSMCRIDTKWFPYDEQFCDMKFGSWTYGGFELDMVHLDSDDVEHISFDNGTEWRVNLGVDISDYQKSVEFDLLSVVGIRHEKRYPCCDYPVIDITYYLNIRRKKLFYTINLMFPCICIATLTSFVFYLPSESNNKITLCISILVALTIFFLLLIEIVPPTSLVTPLIGKYLVFTMFMVTLSVVLTVISLNIHHRNTQPMPSFVRRFFIYFLGHYILIYRQPASPYSGKRRLNCHAESFEPNLNWHQRAHSVVLDLSASKFCAHFSYETETKKLPSASALRILNEHFRKYEASEPINTFVQKSDESDEDITLPYELREKVQQVRYNIRYIERTLRKLRHDEDLQADWRFVAMVVDRLMLVLFSITILVGTLYATIAAPSVHDDRVPITVEHPPHDIFKDP